MALGKSLGIAPKIAMDKDKHRTRITTHFILISQNIFKVGRKCL